MALDSLQHPLVFGEVLFDRFTDPKTGTLNDVLGGAPFNVAWHLQGFGQAPRFVSRVGTDALGQRITAAMQNQGMDTTWLQCDGEHATGTVEVSLTNGEPSYQIVAERAYDFIDQARLPAAVDGTLLYHGTLATRHAVSAGALQQLRTIQNMAVFVDVNLRDPWWTREQVLKLIAGATWVKLNQDELNLLADGDGSLESRARQFVASHHLAAAFVTLGAQGAFAMSRDGMCERLGPPTVTHFVDAVGAGDGFASVLILGLLRGWHLRQTLERAQAFASAIVAQQGATSADPVFYATLLQEWTDG